MRANMFSAGCRRRSRMVVGLMVGAMRALAAEQLARRDDRRAEQGEQHHGLGDQIARRPGNLSHNGSILGQQGIEQTAFPHVWTADDGHAETTADDPPPPE